MQRRSDNCILFEGAIAVALKSTPMIDMENRPPLAARPLFNPMRLALSLCIVLLVALLSRAMTFNRVFERDPEGCGAYYGQLARNYFRFPVISTAAVPINNLGDASHSTRRQFVFYPNHPPLLPLLVAGTYAVCGWDARSNNIPPDWQSRLSSSLFTVALTLSIFTLLYRRVSDRAAIIGGVLFSLLPMTLMFGSQPDVISPQLCFFTLWTVVAYLKFSAAPSLKTLLFLIAMFLPAVATDWPAFYLLPVLCTHYAMTHHPRRWGWIIAFGLSGCAIFLGLYYQAVFVTHDWHWMGKLIERRALSSESDRGTQITLTGWIDQALRQHAIGNISWPVFALMIAWAIRRLVPTRIKTANSSLQYPGERQGEGSSISTQRPHVSQDHNVPLPTSPRVRREASENANSLVWLMLAWAVVHVVVGRQGVFVHEWWWWPLAPGAVMAAALMLEELLQSQYMRPMRSAIAISILAIALLAFGMVNASVVHAKLSRPSVIVQNDLNYSLPELGDAIRAAAPLNGCVMLAESDETLGLWFYADRPIKRFVWYPEKFEERLSDPWSDLPFGLFQKWTDPPVAMILPKAFVSAVPKLKDYLDGNFPSTETTKFISYDLTRPKDIQGRILMPTDD